MSLPSHLSSYRSSTVVDHVKRWKVTALCTYHQSTLIACSDGALRQFEGDDDRVVWREKALSDDFGGSKRPVDLLAVVHVQPPLHPRGQPAPPAPTEDALLLSIANGVCRVHTLPTLRSLSILADSKGCYLLAVSSPTYTLPPPAPSSASGSRLSSASSSAAASSQPLLLCLANKRKQLLLYAYQSYAASPAALNGDFALTSTLPVDDSVRCLTWCGDSALVAGVGRDYLLLHPDQPRGAPQRLFDCGRKAPSPVAALVEGKDEREVVLTQDTRGICIHDDGSPSRKEGLTFSDIPLALLSHPPYLLALLPQSIEIRQTRSGLLTQTIPIKDGGRWLDKHGDCVFVAGPGYVRCLYPIPLRELVEECMKRGQYREAMGLVQMSDDMQWRGGGEERVERLNEVHTLYAYELFNHGDYQAAMMYFQQSHCNPVHILSLFPDVLPSHTQPLLQSMHIAAIKHPVRVTSAQGEQALLKALAALIPYLANMQNKIRLQQAGGGHGGAGEDLTSLASLIDTVLLKAYLLSDIPLLPFLQQPNACDVAECSAILRAYEKYPELVCLFQQHGEHREALDLLTSIGQASFTATADKPLRPSQEPLAGIAPTIAYLQQLLSQAGAAGPGAKDGPLSLVMEYSRWVFERDADSALTIFTREMEEEGRSSVSPAAVFEFLRQVTDREHCTRYLEALIERTGEVDSLLHNELVFLYLDAVLKLMRQEERGKHSQDSSRDASGHSTPVDGKKKPARRTPSQLSSPSTLSAKDAEALAGLRRRLLSFLRRSAHYNSERLLSKFPRHHLLEERCILLSRINQHEEALHILAHQLKDPAAAERYCIQQYNQRRGRGERKEGDGVQGSNDLFLLLLQVYLRGAGEEEKQGGGAQWEGKGAAPGQFLLAAAVRLLTVHWQHIDAVKALELLPPSTPIALLYPYLVRVMRGQRAERRRGEVVKQLRRGENVQVRLDWMEVRREGVVMDEAVVCGRCGKKMGSASFARYPDGSVVHYGCHRQMGGGGGAAGGGGNGLGGAR